MPTRPKGNCICDGHLVQKLGLYNTYRIHQGRRIIGMTPEQAIDNRKLSTSNPQ